MKTKYILHGGDAQIINTENDPFYAEIELEKAAPDLVSLYLPEFEYKIFYK